MPKRPTTPDTMVSEFGKKRELTNEFIDKLLEKEDEPITLAVGLRYPIPKQRGPLRFYDRTLICQDPCRAPTSMTVNGVPRCAAHALRLLNQMLVELGA